MKKYGKKDLDSLEKKYLSQLEKTNELQRWIETKYRYDEKKAKELKEISKLQEWLQQNSQQMFDKNSLQSAELGGHVALKTKSEGGICPSKEWVDELLKDCGKKMGINYVPR